MPIGMPPIFKALSGEVNASSIISILQPVSVPGILTIPAIVIAAIPQTNRKTSRFSSITFILKGPNSTAINITRNPAKIPGSRAITFFPPNIIKPQSLNNILLNSVRA